MQCQFAFCVYQSDGMCLLDSISIDSMGMCEDCIVVNLDDAVLQEKKQETLIRFQAEDAFYQIMRQKLKQR